MLCGYTVPPPGLSGNSDNLEQNQDWHVWISEPETDREEGVAAFFPLHLMSIIKQERTGCVYKFLLTGSHQIKWEAHGRC